jgi:ribosome biogenesis GTPase
MNLSLLELGWSDFFKKHFEPYQTQGLIPARVACEKKYHYDVYCENGEFDAEVSGRFRFNAQASGDFPAVGDWVALHIGEDKNKGIIQGLMPRKTSFSRKVAGMKTDEQILAANIDIVFLVCGLDREFNVRRIERYLVQCYNDDFKPIIVLNKLDMCTHIEDRMRDVEAIAFDVPVLPISALRNVNVEMLRTYLLLGTTAVFFGSSGVGKSTIINRLLGTERQAVMSTSMSTGKGKHVTVARELIPVPTGGLLIDTPGVRELQLWSSEDDLRTSFKDIEELARYCRFRDCTHTQEPGCAVKKAIQDSALDIKHYKNYLKLKKELRFLATRKKKTSLYSKRKKGDKKVDKRTMYLENYYE